MTLHETNSSENVRVVYFACISYPVFNSQTNLCSKRLCTEVCKRCWETRRLSPTMKVLWSAGEQVPRLSHAPWGFTVSTVDPLAINHHDPVPGASFLLMWPRSISNISHIGYIRDFYFSFYFPASFLGFLRLLCERRWCNVLPILAFLPDTFFTTVGLEVPLLRLLRNNRIQETPVLEHIVQQQWPGITRVQECSKTQVSPRMTVHIRPTGCGTKNTVGMSVNSKDYNFPFLPSTCLLACVFLRLLTSFLFTCSSI